MGETRVVSLFRGLCPSLTPTGVSVCGQVKCTNKNKESKFRTATYTVGVSSLVHVLPVFIIGSYVSISRRLSGPPNSRLTEVSLVEDWD